MYVRSAWDWIGVVGLVTTVSWGEGCKLTSSLEGYNSHGPDAAADSSVAGGGHGGGAGHVGGGGASGDSGKSGAGGASGEGGGGGASGEAGHGGQSGAAGQGGNGGAAGGSCDLHASGTECDSCIRKYCFDECVRCSSMSECVALYRCIASCPVMDYTDVCATSCVSDHAGAISTLLDLAGPAGCGEQFCDEQCHDNRTKGPSCKGVANKCGANADQPCCANTFIAGGEFAMGRSTNGTDSCEPGVDDCPMREQPEHKVTVSDFRMDVFEVTVGRFRRFVNAYPSSKPQAGAGTHWAQLGSGWRAEWDTSLPATADELKQGMSSCADHTWTDNATAEHEYLPINCVTWYEAFAFCIWDGSALPTEAQWEYAAAGGDENRKYPWGEIEPHPTLALFGCADRDGGACSVNDLVRVGSFPGGLGRWGQYDLAGSMREWVLDWRDDSWYGGKGLNCSDCANVDQPDSFKVRGARGGSWIDSLHDRRLPFRSAFRGGNKPDLRLRNVGFRCVRWP